MLVEKVKVFRAKLKYVSSEFFYVVSELRNGIGKFFVSSDIYSLAFMIKFLFKRLNFKLNVIVENVVEKLFDFRSLF